MTATVENAPPYAPQVRRITIQDIDDALTKGMRDFRRAPHYGIFFSLVYVLTGVALWVLFTYSGKLWWIIPFAMGFPLVAPFAAIGLYEVSRRIEAGEPLVFSEVLAVLWRAKDRELPMIGLVIFFVFMAWILIAYGIFATFFGPASMTNITSSLALMGSLRGMMMLAAGGAVGAGIAAVLFMLTVISLPLLLDREIDVVTAMQTSIRSVWTNPRVMFSWAGLIAGLLAIGMFPAFLGLFVVLPVLGHASWHVYRRVTG